MEKAIGGVDMKTFKAMATLTDGVLEWDVVIYSNYGSEEAAIAGIDRFSAHGYRIVKTWIE